MLYDDDATVALNCLFHAIWQDLVARNGLYLIKVSADDVSAHHVVAAVPAVSMRYDMHRSTAVSWWRLAGWTEGCVGSCLAPGCRTHFDEKAAISRLS